MAFQFDRFAGRNGSVDAVKMSEENPLEHLDDQYEVIARLHEGGMGAIFKVRHRFLEQTRVVKVLHSRLSTESEFQERFQREARLATSVRHPNIAEVYDFSIKEGTAFLIMEYIEGVNFGQLLESGGPPKIETTLEMCIQALAALGHIHQRSLVHRDISPDNLMLTKDDLGRPLVKLIDLGIVKPLAEDTTLTKTGLFMGKLHYASPEQFGQTEDGVELDQRSDLYSFGIVLYQMLTGEVPYSGSESAIIAGHLFHPPRDFERTDPDHRIPTELRKIVLKSIEKKADDRYQTAQDLSDALHSFLTGEALPAPAPERASRASEEATAVAPTGERSKHSDALLSGAERLAQLGEFDEARSQLETVLMLDPTHTGAQQLLRRVCDTQLAPLLGEASKLMISKSFDEAVERLNEAMVIDPKNESIIRLLNDAKAGLHAKREKEELEHKLEDLQSFVDSALADDRPEDAEAKLGEASMDLGTRAEFQTLREKVEQAMRRKVDRQVADLLGQAAKAAKAKSFDEALGLLDQVVELAPDNEDALSQRRQVRQASEKFEEEKKSKAVAQALGDIQAALKASDFDTASDLLAEARAVGVSDTAIQQQLDALQQRLDSEAEKQRVVASFRGKISNLVESEDLAEAQETLDQARAQVSRATAFADLAEKIEQLTQEKEAHDKEERYARACTEIAALLDAADFSGARLELAKALRQFPNSDEIKALSERVEQEELAAREAEEATARDQQVGEAVERARAALTDDQLEAAQAAIAEALEVDAESVQALELGKEIEARVEESKAREEARSAAVNLVESGQFEDAAEQLRETLNIHPSDPAIQELLRSVEATLGEQEEEAEQEAEIAGLLVEAGKLEASQDFEAAEQSLAKAAELSPDSTEVAGRLEKVRAAIEGQRAQLEQEDQAGALLQDARQHLENDRLEEARAAAVKVTELVESADATALLGEIDSRLEAAVGQEKVAEIVGRARQLVDKGEYQRALDTLAEARALDPSGAVIDVLEEKVKERIAAEEQAAASAEKAIELVATAGKLRGKGDLAKAESALVEAQQLDADNAEPRILLESVRAEIRQAEEATSRAAEAGKRLDQAQGLFDKGKLESSEAAVREALEIEPDNKPAQQLLAKVEKKLAAQREAAELEEKVSALVTSARSEFKQRRFEAAIAKLEEAQGLGGESREIGKLLSKARAAMAEGRTIVAEGLADIPLEPSDAVAAEPPPVPVTREASPAPVAKEASSASGLLANKKLLIGAGAGVVVVAVLLFTLMGGEKTPGGEPQSAPTGAVAAHFVLDATPWAQVVSIEDADGNAMDLGENRYTPLVLDLPPGRYRVGLTNAEMSDVRYEDVEIVAGEAGRRRVEMGEVDLDTYFEEAGWLE